MADAESRLPTLGGSITVAAGQTARLRIGPFLSGDIISGVRCSLISSDDTTDNTPRTVGVALYVFNQQPQDTQAAVENGETVISPSSLAAVPVHISAGHNLHTVHESVPCAMRVSQRARYFAIQLTAPAGVDWTGSVFMQAFRQLIEEKK